MKFLSATHKTCLFLIAFAFCAASAFSQTNGDAAKSLSTTTRERNISKNVETLLKVSHLSKRPTDEELSERAFDLYFKALDPMKVYFYQSDIDEFAKRKKEIGAMVTSGNIGFAFDIFNRYLQRVDERIALVQGILSGPVDLNTDEEIVVDRKLMEYPKNEAEAKDKWLKRVVYELLSLKAEEIEKAKDKAEADAKKQREAAGYSPEQLKKAEEDWKKYWETEGAAAATTAASDIEALTKRLKRRYNFYGKRMRQTNNDELLEIFLTAVANSYDPHTSYMSPSNYKNFIIMMSLNLKGIGATLQSIDGFTVVNKLVPGGPADKSGLIKADDRIVAVGQNENGPMIDVYDMKLTDVVDKVRGDSGTKVRLEIVSPENADAYAEYKEEGKPKPPTKTITIVREKVDLDNQAVKSEIFDAGTKPDGSPYRIGVISLPSFYLDIDAAQKGDPNYRNTTSDIRKILAKFVLDNVDAVVLDLRNNGGGSLPEVVSTTGLFIDTGTVVMTKDATRTNNLDDRNSAIEWTGPLVVVINKFSASASEILAGAIKDYKRGLIVGDSSTHGKGSVQELKDIGKIVYRGMPNAPELGALKLTVSGFFLPGGVSPQLDGVASDVVLPSITDHLQDFSERDLDYPLSFDPIPASKNLPKFQYVQDDVVEKVREKSAERVAKDSDFQKTLRDVKTYIDLKDKKKRTLNEKKFFEEKERLRAEKDEADKLEELANDTESKIKRDNYLNEVLALTVDYIQALDADGISFPKEKSVKGGGGILGSLFGN
ncbi:MAG: carboxy terminal-processing peptidase [Thermoguttaceae bacterium]